MQNDLVTPDWPALSEREIADVLAQYFRSDLLNSIPPRVTWRSPRPMSVGALVTTGTRRVFVKRHHVRVRSRERLELEHAFGRHLRARGVNTPAVMTSRRGSSVVEREDFLYEVHELAAGVDVYRDVPSWHPFQHRAHARSAGAALARFHRASADFDAPPGRFGALVDSVEILRAASPTQAYLRLVTGRHELADSLSSYDLRNDFETYLREPVEAAALRARGLDPRWTHGDWHASNLTWDRDSPNAGVASVLDLGLANRTLVMHDLATAIERNIIDWLDTKGAGRISVDFDALDDLLGGYHQVSPLTGEDIETLRVLLPVAHVEFALSEVEYFGAIVRSPSNADLAYSSYLLGHVQWFASPDGAALLTHLADNGHRSDVSGAARSERRSSKNGAEVTVGQTAIPDEGAGG